MFDFDTYLIEKRSQAGWNLGDLMVRMVEDLRGHKEEVMDRTYPQDYASEFADNWVPVYNNMLLDLALDNLSLGYGPEDECYLGDNPKSAYDFIRAAVYEQLHEVTSTLIETWLQEERDVA